MVKKHFLLLFILFNTICIYADTWQEAKITITYSKNKEYMLKVYPRKYPQNYFTYKYQRQIKKGVAKDTVTPCHAVLYYITYSDTIEVWDKQLVNFTSPVEVLVANDGKSVVTFDEWGMAGYNHAIVIYGESGELINDFDLEEISPFPMEQYAYTMSSRSWRKHGEYLDNNRVIIQFNNRYDEVKELIFNLNDQISKIDTLSLHNQFYSSDTIDNIYTMTVISKAPSYKSNYSVKADVDSLNNFITKNLIYPRTALQDSLEGTVYVEFWIDTLGQTYDHRILRGIRDDLDEEALRVTKLIRFEKPAMQLSRPIKIQYSTRVVFKFGKKDDEEKTESY